MEDKNLTISAENAAKEEKARYAREWRKKNPGKNAEYVRRYWEKKALARLQQEKEAEDDN